MEEMMTKIFSVKAIVDKKREIYFIDNVKFHIDAVEGLGAFIEVEALDVDGSIGLKRLQEQCEHYKRKLCVSHEQLVKHSYSDLLLG